MTFDLKSLFWERGCHFTTYLLRTTTICWWEHLYLPANNFPSR